MKNTLIPYINDMSNRRDISINSSVVLQRDRVFVSFSILGNLGVYNLPKVNQSQRLHDLWKASCFELFLANSQNSAYYELNLSPSLAWNFYYLKDYRAIPKEVLMEDKMKMEVMHNESFFKISCEFKIETNVFNLYNVAVILLNEKNERNFWSVYHRGTEPDFHHRSNFIRI